MIFAMCIAGTWYFPNYSDLQIRNGGISGSFPAYDAPGGRQSAGSYWNPNSHPDAAVTLLGCTVQGNDIWLHVRGNSSDAEPGFEYELERYVKLDDVLKNPAMKISITSGRWNN